MRFLNLICALYLSLSPFHYLQLNSSVFSYASLFSFNHSHAQSYTLQKAIERVVLTHPQARAKRFEIQTATLPFFGPGGSGSEPL